VKDTQLLQSLKFQILEYKTFDCKLRHKEVIDIEFNVGTDCFGIALEPNYERIGFCNKAYRNSNITCAHTMALLI
jgi:hypothetical protein